MYAELIGAGLVIFEQRKNIKNLFSRIQYIIKNRKSNILIFGPPGVGKTTLARILSGETDIRKDVPKYISSWSVEKYRLKIDLPTKVIVGPGQERRALSTWDQLYRKLSSGNANGIIFVVSYGYHSISDLGFRESVKHSKRSSQKSILKKYFKDKRDYEIKVIRTLLNRIKDARKRIWMITLVTKQDLWWNQRKLVRDHYLKGAYNNEIEEIIRYRGDKNFQHEYWSCSLVISNMADGKEEEMKKNVSGYDQRLQNENYQKLLNLLYTLIYKEE